MNRMEQGIASIPRQTVIRDQPHMLAYITPAEAMLLKQNGGSGLPSHGGVPEFGFWSETFGGGNSFDQSMSNTFGGNDGGSFVGGEWQGNTISVEGDGSVIREPAPTRTTRNDGYDFDGNKVDAGTVTNIQGPTSFFNSLQNRPIEGWAAYHGGIGSAANSSDNDDISRAGMMGSGVNIGVNPNVIPVDDGATVEPVRSGLPTFVTGEEDRVEQATISDILKPIQYARSEPSQNNPYLYQELLNMYKNPYA
jgi:hypothetical protein